MTGKLRVLGLRTEFRTDEGDDSFFKNGFTFDNEFGAPLDANKSLYKNLFIDDNDSFIVSSTPKAFCAIHEEDFGDEFFISEEELDAYSEGVLEVLTKQNIEGIITSQDLDADELLDDAGDDSDTTSDDTHVFAEHSPENQEFIESESSHEPGISNVEQSVSVETDSNAPAT